MQQKYKHFNKELHFTYFYKKGTHNKHAKDNLHGMGNCVSFTQNLCQVLEQDQRWQPRDQHDQQGQDHHRQEDQDHHHQQGQDQQYEQDQKINNIKITTFVPSTFLRVVAARSRVE